MTFLDFLIEKAESNTLDLGSIEIGDIVYIGRFKNRKAEVKGFEKDKHGQPILKTNKGKVALYKGRLERLMPEKEEKKEDK
jgi:hypothetical protein